MTEHQHLSMGAETLRRAADDMREDYAASETDMGEHDPFIFAVADWLVGVAVDVDKRDNPARVGGRYEALRIPDERAALAVARAYLREQR